jgi:hypothetical protein
MLFAFVARTGLEWPVRSNRALCNATTMENVLMANVFVEQDLREMIVQFAPVRQTATTTEIAPTSLANAMLAGPDMIVL